MYRSCQKEQGTANKAHFSEQCRLIRRERARNNMARQYVTAPNKQFISAFSTNHGTRMNACLAQLLIVLVHLNLGAGQCTGTSCCVGDGKPEAKTCQCWTDRSKIRNCAPGQTCDHQASKCTTPPSTPTCQANGGPESAACECGSSKAPCAVGDTCDVSGTGALCAFRSPLIQRIFR